MKPKDLPLPNQEQLRHARAARSPISYLSGEEFARLKGHLVALLLDGPEKGKVIATAALDFEHPDSPRTLIKKQVAASSYKNHLYQVCQILDDAKKE